MVIGKSRTMPTRHPSSIILTMNSAAYLTTLHRLLNGYFSLEEIRTLCFNLHIDYESVPGEEKQSRIRELLLGLGRRSRLTDLIPLLQQERPLVDWPPVPDDFRLPESLAEETAVAANQYHVYGDMVQGDRITIGDVSDGSVVAAGAGAVAVGSRGVYVTGNVHGSIHTGDVINYYITGAQTYFPQFTVAIENFFTHYLGTEKEPVPFGGRNQELAQLDNWLAQESTQRLLLVSPAGRGKSALLARWSQQFTAVDNLDVVFMPISLRFNTNQEDNTFVILATRLAHFYGKQIPTNYANMSPHFWRGLVADYLREPLPNGRQLLLILDGLDEAAWDVTADILPLDLPTTTQVVVSARYLGGEKQTPERWLRRLGWYGLAKVETMELGKLSHDDVREVFQQLNCSLREQEQADSVVKAVYDLSKGDPLLVHIYFEDLCPRDGKAPRLRPKDLKHKEPGYEGYFDDWWAHQKRLWEARNERPLQEPMVLAIRHLLSMAYGPLSTEDIQNLLPETMSADSAFIQEAAIPYLGRFVIGDGRKQGFVFSHPKLADYFRSRLTERDKTMWQGRFLVWGKRTLADLKTGRANPASVPQYLMQYYGRHLEDTDADIENFLELVTWEWMQVWHKKTGTYAGFLQDVDRVWDRLRVANETAVKQAERVSFLGQEVLCALCHASVNSITNNIPDELLVLLLQRKIWSEEQAIAYVRQRNNLEKRCRAFALILPHLSQETHVIIKQEILLMLEGFDVEALRHVLPTVAHALPAEALAVAQRIGGEHCLIEVLPVVASKLPEQTLLAVPQISEQWQQMDLLMAVAPHLPEKTLATAREIGIDTAWKWKDLLVALASKLPQEILAVTEEMRNEWDRADVLRALAPELPDKVLAASRSLADEKYRADILAAIAPRLHNEVLAESQTLTDKLCQAQVLASVIPYLPVQMRPALCQDVLTTARSIGKEECEDHICERLARLLVAIAPQLPLEEQAAVWDEVLEASKAISKKRHRPRAWDGIAETEASGSRRRIHRATVLAEIAPYFPVEMQPYVWDEAFYTAKGMMSRWQSVDLIATIASHIPSYALEAIRGMRGERYQVPVLVAIAPSLPQEVFAAAQEIGNEVAVLEAVAPYLPQESLQNFLAVVREIYDSENRDKLLAAVAPHFLVETLAAAQEINDEVERAEVLRAIAPHLPKDILALTPEIGNEVSRSYVLAALAPYKPQEVLTAARGIKDAGSRAYTLESVISRLPVEVRPIALKEALAAAREIEDEEHRANALARVIPHLEEKSRPAVLEEAMTAAREIKVGSQYTIAEVLAYLIAPKVPEDMRAVVWERAKKAVSWIDNDSLRKAVIAEIDKSEHPSPAPPPVSEDEREFAVTLEEIVASCELDDDWERLIKLFRLDEQAFYVDLPQLYRAWQVTILALSRRKRPSLFSDITVLISAIFNLGGETAVRDTLQSVQTASKWWR